MAIEIDDYKPVRTHWSGEGLVPLGAFDSETGARTRLIQSVSGMAEEAGEVNRVIATGNRAEFNRGLDLLGRDLLREFGQRDDYEHFEREWDSEFRARLPDYVSTDAYGLDSEEVGRAIEQSSLRGKAALQGMARVGMLRRAKSMWKDNLGDAARSGDLDAVERTLEEGIGVFIPPGRESSFVADTRRKADENLYLEEARRQPMETLSAISAGKHPASGDAGLESKVGEEALAWRNKWRAEYGKLLLEAAETQGGLDEQYLNAGVDRGLISMEQAGLCRAALDRTFTERGNGNQPSGPEREAALSEWIRRIDECGGGDEETAALSMELLGGGLPREDLELLARRFRKNTGLDSGMRARVSRELYRYYRSGAWGVPGELPALGVWKAFQNRLGSLVDEYGEQAPDKMQELLDQCKSGQEEAWFCFEGQDGQRKNGNR